MGQVKEVKILGNPIVDEDRVTLRVKVTGEGDRSVMDLIDTNFQLRVDGKSLDLNPKDWKSPEETIPPPAYVVVLVDFSGSMESKDSSGKTKLEGAIKAIREFISTASKRGGTTEVSIVPFGESGEKCQGYEVSEEELGNFFSAADVKLTNYLEYLENQDLCASTDLYAPLTKAIRFLGDTSNPDFYPLQNLEEESTANSNLPQPRLSIILVSDGYHNKPNEIQDFDALKDTIKRKSNIVIHTLGYGLTPEQLGEKYKLNRPVTRRDLGNKKEQVRPEEFVDRDRLSEIAQLTGGIAEFSGNAQTIADSLQTFLNALLGEYEMSYYEPNPVRGSKHEVKVIITSDDKIPVTSESEGYTIKIWITPPRGVRLSILIGTLFFLVTGGLIPFYLWGQHLKQSDQE